jgi:hypothetical protein
LIRTQSIIRGWCFVACGLYCIVLVSILAIYIDSSFDDLGQHSELEKVLGPVVLVVELSALSIFAWGTSVWDYSLLWWARAIGWLILFMGLVPLVTFSIFLGPLLVSMIPALWAWHRAPRRVAS